MDEVCILCGVDGMVENNSVHVTRGLEMLKNVSMNKKDGIADKIEGLSHLRVHKQCRKNYTRNCSFVPVSLPTGANTTKSYLRSNLRPFDFKTCCLFCGETVDKESYRKHPHRYPKICQVETVHKISSIRNVCAKRCDNWGEIVLNRINSKCDLIAADAQYHKNCNTRFFVIGSSMPGQPSENFVGRPVDELKLDAFNKLCDFLDNNDVCQYTLSEFMDMLSDFATESGNSYSEKRLRELLLAQYGNTVLITPSMKGFGTVVSFRPVASKILTDNWYTRREKDAGEEKKRIIDAAVAILQEEIRSQVYDFSTYPTSEEISIGGKDQVGELLIYMLSGLMKPVKGPPCHKKVLSVAHSITSSVRPRSFVSAVQVGIGVFIHRRFRSRHLINILHNLGCCVSYSEISKYESSVTVNESCEVQDNGFVQFVFDNADHNTRTLDGHGTFHVMGGVKCVTPFSAVQATCRIPRPKIQPATSVVGKFGFIPIVNYDRPKNHGLNRLVMEDILSLKLQPINAELGTTYQWIWMSGPKSNKELHPGWSGFMEIVSGKKFYEKSAVIPLPFVNLQPSNPTSINTCLHFAAEECRKRQQKCIVTFDQPLYIKAMDIVSQADESDDVSKVIVRLGGFHLLMSYMGAVAKIMGGSGLEEMWNEVFAKNAIVHMAKGHAYARALRAHSLSQAAIAHLIMEYCKENGFLNSSGVRTIKEVYSEVINTSSLSEEYIISKVKPFLCAISSGMNTLEEKSRTAKLWLRYFKQVSIMHDFVKAERTGDWNLHLFSVQRMLVHLHAASHIHYAKSAHLYLQSMLKLETTLSEQEFQQFVSKGYLQFGDRISFGAAFGLT